jgi:hypothetical protein
MGLGKAQGFAVSRILKGFFSPLKKKSRQASKSPKAKKTASCFFYLWGCYLHNKAKNKKATKIKKQDPATPPPPHPGDDSQF